MATTPRITISLSKEKQELLNKLVKRLDMRSSAQLLEYLVSGNHQKIDLVCSEAKHLFDLF